MPTTTLKETPLADIHRKSGARMVDFAGWNMPVQYKSIITEHNAVRTRVGLFDVSHMGEFVIKGEDAAGLVQKVIANDLNKLTKPDMALYTQMVNEKGGTVDDLIVYRREEDFLLVVNASNIDKDWKWITSHAGSYKNLKLQNISEDTGLLALQGPEAVRLLCDIAGNWVSDIPSFGYGTASFEGINFSFGRTGYTGEDGFEIFVAANESPQLWNILMDRGQKYGIEPCGLGARDTLRLEAALPLYGHELDDETSPLEAGLGWSVKLDKGDFIGRDAMKKQKEEGLPKQCLCLKTESKALPRQGYRVFADDRDVGVVTSGSQGIFVGYPIAFAFAPPQYAKVGQTLQIEIRESKVPATVVQRPFYRAVKKG